MEQNKCIVASIIELMFFNFFFFFIVKASLWGIIHLVRTQNFPEKFFYPYQGVRNVDFSENFAYVLTE